MKTKQILTAIVVLALLLGGFSNPSAVRADWSKVDPRLLDQLEANGTAKFHVVMAVQADVSGAAQLGSKVEKTTYVYNLLRRTAAASQAPLLSRLQAEGAEYESFYIYNMISITAGRPTVEWLAARPEVARIVLPPEPHTEPVVHSSPGPELPLLQQFGPSRAGEAIEWNITRVNADDVWNMGFHGEGMVVASNDTGVDYTHPALVNQYRGNLGGGSFDHNYNWWDGDAGTDYPYDYDGHGTHTTGTMVGDDGGVNQVGMAPGAKWIACGGLGGTDTVECFEFFLAPWDLNHQNPDPARAPDAINNSWYDTSGYDYRPIIQNLNAAGVAVIKSAGNWGAACSTISPPGNVPEIISTAAFAQGDVIADFSSRGPDSSYGQTILKPEVAAPGVNVRSSYPPNGYTTMDGTSMAAPHSTGLVALIWSAASCLRGDVPLTKQIMMETAEAKIDGQCAPFVDHPNDVWGWGILDAQAAVDAAIGYCGGLGTLQGTLTDESTGLPIEAAKVNAQGASGYNREKLSDAAGFYTMDIPSDTYTVTASAYGYATGEVYPVEVISGEVTVQDFSLLPLPTYTVSGHLYDAVSGAPLQGEVEVIDAPLAPVPTDPSGYYTLSLPQGSWSMQAKAPVHMPQVLVVEINGDVTVNFQLDPLPCILLVDDDQDAPDVRSYYTAALDDLGLGYNVWDVSTSGDPAAGDLTGYKQVFWFNGYPYANTFNVANEAAVGAYLDAGGNFFLSSQDYLYDFGLTPFGQNYLHIQSYISDAGQLSVTGQNFFSGLGPYNLNYFYNNYSDTINPDVLAQLAFSGDKGNAAVYYAGDNFNTAFLGYPFEAIPQVDGRSAVLERMVDLFGGCLPPIAITPEQQSQTSAPGMQVSYVYTVTNQADVAQEVTLNLASGWPAQAPASAGELAPGASATVPVTVTIPAVPTVIIASDTFTLTATGASEGEAFAFGTTLVNVNPGVEVTAPGDGAGRPLEVVPYEFTVTNTGDYTDSFSLLVSGIGWNATLPGGDHTGPLAPGATTSVSVWVEVPAGAAHGDAEVTTLMVVSELDQAVSASQHVVTNAVVLFYIRMPIIHR